MAYFYLLYSVSPHKTKSELEHETRFIDSHHSIQSQYYSILAPTQVRTHCQYMHTLPLLSWPTLRWLLSLLIVTNLWKTFTVKHMLFLPCMESRGIPVTIMPGHYFFVCAWRVRPWPVEHLYCHESTCTPIGLNELIYILQAKNFDGRVSKLYLCTSSGTWLAFGRT